MRYLPLFVDLQGRRVVVIGAGVAACGKLRMLLRTPAEIHVYLAGETPPATSSGIDPARVHVHADVPGDDALRAAALVYIALEDVALSRGLASRCRALGVPLNVVDDQGSSDFISAALIDRDPVVVAIGSEGCAPSLVRTLKSRIEQLLPADTGNLALLARQLRPAVRSGLEPSAQRRFWHRFFAGEGLRRLRLEGAAQARRFFQTHLRSAAPEAQCQGRVSLVGAGPGDPDLLTLRARQRLETADVVLYDRLVDPRVLDLARRDARLVEVGKRPDGESWRQQDINQALVAHARTGAEVVRLKSGDPMVFGRADEEIEALEAAALAYDIVPGVTAAAAAAATAAASLTRRGRNRALVFLTAQDADGYAEHDWRALATGTQSVAVYMGVRAARFVQGRLLLHGAAPTTPVLVAEQVSRPAQRLINTSLGHLAETLELEGIAGPAVLLIGLQGRMSPAAQAESGPVPLCAANGD